MSKEKLEECFKGYLEQANNLGERGFCQDTDDYQEFLKDAIDELFGYMYECGFSANKKQAECYKQLQRKTAELDKIEEVIAPYQEPLEADAFSLSGAIKSILQRKTAEHERLCRDYFKQNEWLQQRAKECEQLQHKLQMATEALEIIANQNFKYTSENICNLAQNEQIPCSNNCKYCFQQYAQHALEQILSLIHI